MQTLCVRVPLDLNKVFFLCALKKYIYVYIFPNYIRYYYIKAAEILFLYNVNATKKLQT